MRKLSVNNAIRPRFIPVVKIGSRCIAITSVLFLCAPSPGYGEGAQVSNISAIWANTGEDKVTRDERRASVGQAVTNSVWDGSRIKIFGAKNEVVSFNLVLESGSETAENVSVSLRQLSGPNGARISTKAVTVDGVFDWIGRNIELFYVRYLPIKGLSRLSYADYDERHVPQRFRRPWTGDGEVEKGKTWLDRPDHDKSYPDIAVPLELVNNFPIPAGQNQSIWADIYIPKTVPAGTYQGTLTITENGSANKQVPVELQVRNFTLPDTPSAKTMLYLSLGDINRRYIIGPTDPDRPPPDICNIIELNKISKRVYDRHFLLAHRHRISLIDENDGNCTWDNDQPRPGWIPRLDGALFSEVKAYDGPGRNIGNGVFSIGTYGQWCWKCDGKASMWRHSNNWVKWFEKHSPDTEYFLYLIDEPNIKQVEKVQTWLRWIDENPGVGRELKSFSTVDLTIANTLLPSLDIVASTFDVGLRSTWQNALYNWRKDRKQFYLYNGHRPATGSFATEDDGVALRVIAWSQVKKGADRWFFWQSTYYKNSQCDGAETDLFNQAQTFGCFSDIDGSMGQTGWNYSNGDGVLFYPGTDKFYPESSYNITGPIASLRLKHWRRGIQDVEYLRLAKQANPRKVAEIINATIPKVLWEYGADAPCDPTYVTTDISWSTNPDDWEMQRKTLADIIERGN